MAKAQKTVMVPEDLCKLAAVLEEKGGASFTRIVIAALLNYFFEAFQNPEKGKGKGPDPVWMRWAVLLERGDVSIGDLPLSMLDGFIDTADLLIRSKDPDGKPALGPNDFVASWTARAKDVRAIRRRWQADIEEHGGTMEAMIKELESYWVK